MSGRRWLPPALWAALILVLTSIPSPPEAPGGIPHLDKVVHFVLYAGLGWLSSRALRTRRPMTLSVLFFSLLAFAAFDEWHQRFFARNPGMLDWIADAIGVSAGMLAASRVRRIEAAP
ncbi:MAG TPA: VanZ family protein [Gemmatimonadaceae bacterium]|nr:VanZ family protein [Gemmatimonadaceae bacterium]